MTNKDVKEQIDKKRGDYESLAELYGFEYNKYFDYIVSKVFTDGCQFAYDKAVEEFGGKDMNAVMHRLMINNIIEAIRKHRTESIVLNDCISKEFGAIPYPDGIIRSDYGKIGIITIKDDGLLFEVPGRGFIMQNELTVLDLLHIYQYIPVAK